MRVLVMAAGSVGGYFGGVLAKGGNEVKFVARNENLAQIKANGLVVQSATTGSFVVESADAVDSLDGDWQADLVLFCVKSYHNEVAIEQMKPAIGPNTTILTLQNGLGSADELSATFGEDAVMLGAAYVEAERLSPGVFAEHGGTCRLVFGERDGSWSERGLNILKTFNGAGIEGILSDDVSATLWTKLVFISALSGITCICRSSMVEALDNPSTADLTLRILEETTNVGRAAGVIIPTDMAQTTMAQFQR
ncbi:MAG TPA: 2-dehydropantoate 2-reductase, partial [Dehalococcoidia bacterium]|nr:2-dehydropantoate 2-reductase [Dehalococcoidia bacterium]